MVSDGSWSHMLCHFVKLCCLCQFGCLDHAGARTFRPNEKRKGKKKGRKKGRKKEKKEKEKKEKREGEKHNPRRRVH